MPSHSVLEILRNSFLFSLPNVPSASKQNCGNRDCNHSLVAYRARVLPFFDLRQGCVQRILLAGITGRPGIPRVHRWIRLSSSARHKHTDNHHAHARRGRTVSRIGSRRSRPNGNSSDGSGCKASMGGAGLVSAPPGETPQTGPYHGFPFGPIRDTHGASACSCAMPCGRRGAPSLPNTVRGSAGAAF